ncbi:MAG TPA: peptidase MA family metallohydrolase [Anaerolineales bacterium]|nr:peptidase MA family metallohydrolase [Anaerolineales bacterium]
MNSHKPIPSVFRWLISLFMMGCLLIPSIAVQAQATVSNTSVEYKFGEQISFKALVQSPLPIEKAFVIFRVSGESVTRSSEAEIIYQDGTTYQIASTYPLDNQPLRAFTQVEYRFQARLQGGEEFNSPSLSFEYLDNRVEWQNLEQAPFHIAWYAQDDIAFGDNALKTAQEGLKKINSLLPIQTPEHIDIYIYPNASTLQEVLILSGQDWIAGHADPDLGVILAAIPSRPEQSLVMDQIIPHEMMHILVYETVREGYDNLPTWLVEGLASLAELYPNPDYQILLNNALERDTLLKMEDLCAPFPRDASSALLAYAQSASFTRFLHQQFGASRMDDLMQGYTDGLECSRGVEITLGTNLKQLERQWREDVLGEDPARAAAENLLPWLLLALVVLVAPIGLALSRMSRKSDQPAKLDPRDIR